jgi:hypothetical protein
MQTIQTVLNYLALLPIAAAALLFLNYVWQRSAPCKNHRIPDPGKLAELQLIDELIGQCCSLGNTLDAGPEDCDREIEPTRTAEFLELLEQKFAETDQAREDRVSSDTLSQSREPLLDNVSTGRAALEMEPTTAQTTVKEPAIADYNAMSSHQLRRECQSLGIRWRNAHGQSKHLSRPEMLERIREAIA